MSGRIEEPLIDQQRHPTEKALTQLDMLLWARQKLADSRDELLALEEGFATLRM